MEYVRLIAKLSRLASHFSEVAELFALTPEQQDDANCGKYVVDRIKQLQTAYTIRKSSRDNVDFSRIQNPGLPTDQNGVKE